MKTKKLWLGMLILVLAFGMTVVGCGGGSDDDIPPYEPPEKTPLTGTVTITSITTEPTYGNQEKMTLTADTSGLVENTDWPLHPTLYSYQWQRDGTNISDAIRKTYEVTEADFGKTLKVIVKHSNYTGSVEAQSTNHTPTVCTVTIKYATGAFKKSGVVFETSSNIYIASGSENSTTKLWSYNTSAQFKMKESYVNLGTLYYYYKNGTSGSELFDLTNGTRNYTLTNQDGSFGVLTGLVATLE
jgi:hypothetical protein